MILKVKGWYENYRICGCASKTVKRKGDLLGYCRRHGNSRQQVLPVLDIPKAQVRKSRPPLT